MRWSTIVVKHFYELYTILSHLIQRVYVSVQYYRHLLFLMRVVKKYRTVLKKLSALLRWRASLPIYVGITIDSYHSCHRTHLSSEAFLNKHLTHWRLKLYNHTVYTSCRNLCCRAGKDSPMAYHLNPQLHTEYVLVQLNQRVITHLKAPATYGIRTCAT